MYIIKKIKIVYLFTNCLQFCLSFPQPDIDWFVVDNVFLIPNLRPENIVHNNDIFIVLFCLFVCLFWNWETRPQFWQENRKQMESSKWLLKVITVTWPGNPTEILHSGNFFHEEERCIKIYWDLISDKNKPSSKHT